MEIFTVDRNYQNADLIDDFKSVIWTERYYGDSEVQLVLPMSRETLEKVPLGILIGCSDSDELMILEEGKIEKGLITYSGIGILPWLNNRFVRYSPVHSKTNSDSGTIGNAGSAMWGIVWFGAAESSPALNPGGEFYGMPVGYGDRLKIPGLGLREFDSVPSFVDGVAYTAKFGPVYDLVRELATAYQIGCKIDWKPDADPILGFRAYRGVDRTSQQSAYPVVRFSPQLDNLADIKELLSKTNYKNLAFTYSTNAPVDYTTPGIAYTEEASESSGFDLRVAQVFIDDIEDRPFDYDYITELLNGDARAFLGQNRFVRVIDGQIVVTPLFKYGRDYNLGDLVEEQGDTGAVSIGRVVEYIRVQDQNGQREYPTVGELETINTNIVSP